MKVSSLSTLQPYILSENSLIILYLHKISLKLKWTKFTTYRHFDIFELKIWNKKWTLKYEECTQIYFKAMLIYKLQSTSDIFQDFLKLITKKKNENANLEKKDWELLNMLRQNLIYMLWSFSIELFLQDRLA